MKEQIIKILKAETAQLRADYLILCEKFANREFELIEEKNKRTLEQWFDAFGVVYEMKEDRFNKGKLIPSVDSKEYHGKRYYKCRDARAAAHKIVKAGIEGFVARAVKNAELHYENCIAKLAYRIEDKGLDVAKLEVRSASVGYNLETTLTDGNQIVRAFTIIAEGPIIKPHLRYLIK